MNYTHSITSQGQITLPKEFRVKLGLDELGKATLSLNERNEIVITVPKDLQDVRALLSKPSHKDPLSDKELQVGRYLADQYGVR